MSESSSTPIPKDDEMQNRPESPPLGLLDPSRIQNPLADGPGLGPAPGPMVQQQQHGGPPQQMPENFVIPEPRQQPPPQWQRSTPVMSPAAGYPMPVAPGTPGARTTPFMHDNSPQAQAQAQAQQQHFEYQQQQQQYHQQQQYLQQQQQAQAQAYYQQQAQQQPYAYPPGARPWPPRPNQSPAQGPPPPQRVPYPPGQITPGGAPPPGYPVTSPVTRTPPRPYPQGYPQAQQQPQPQQQHTPTGGPYVSPAPPPQMYRGVPPQAPPQQVMAVPRGGPPPQYMSPQQPNTPHNRFPPSVAPQQVQQAQQAPQMTPSPHFGPGPGGPQGPDLRSPNHMISPPTQPGGPPQMRPMPLPQVPSNFQYRTHDLSQFPIINANPELFLTGCVFHIFDVDRLISDKLDLVNIMFSIKFFGGDVDFSPKTYPEKMMHVTHVIIDSYRSPYARGPIEQRKRLVTLQWLMDILQKQRMEVPWKLAHLPGPFTDQFRPYTGKLFAVAGFDETERPAIQFMAESMGAKISPFLAKFNDLLIVKNGGPGAGPKIEKAREWNIVCVNFQWLAEAYCSGSQIPHERPNPENPRFQIGQISVDVNSTPNNMEIQSSDIKSMLLAWKQHIIITEEHCRRAQENRMRLTQDEAHFPNQRLLSQAVAPAPTDEEIAAAEKQREERAEPPRHRVIASLGPGFSEAALDSLKRKLLFLGAKICDDVTDCTHLVLINGRRSLKMLEGICLGKNIMTPDWILDSYKNGNFMDTLDYFMRDEEVERQLGYSCKRSVLRARHRQIFEDVEFYITPSVLPDYETVKNLIELAGGRIVKEKPTARYIARCVETDSAFLIISCDVDVRSMSYLAECNFPIYNVDLVLMSILRQNIELHPVFRVLVMIRYPLARQQYSNPPTVTQQQQQIVARPIQMQ